MHFDPVLLSRIQFAWVVAWHILLPAFTQAMTTEHAALCSVVIRQRETGGPEGHGEMDGQ